MILHILVGCDIKPYIALYFAVTLRSIAFHILALFSNTITINHSKWKCEWIFTM